MTDRTELQKAYRLMQANCGIKKGDTVKVLRKARTDELCVGGKKHGWANMCHSDEKGIRFQRCDLCGKWREVTIDDKST